MNEINCTGEGKSSNSGGDDMTRNAKAGRYLILDIVSMKDKGDYERTGI